MHTMKRKVGVGVMYQKDEDEEDLCECGHDVEDHNEIGKNSMKKNSTSCHKCSCTRWETIDAPF